ncbi:NAD-dependent DNA ligase LigA [Mongoliitalea daihaiensis]|uniref:NAD-dependent DNA ligase LigA n=1 Tax=Mongoliitalea daihaiensis TaxID=2782006 RepID=UPI001F45FEE5|nr:NAD-dependent DNA ligase LigA [Mongoliitalea daihaiensis]UJP63518.1 NAD-dependent DNA ligase LigA [Mongoliitalea daihaiensis]
MTSQEAQLRISELSNQINYHNQLYYNEDRSEISDFEFDQLLQELITLETQFPEFLDADSPSQRVGGTITKEFETVEHEYRMLSLGNTYSPEELLAFDERVAKGLGHRNYEYFCELKFDGVAISLVYENGRLIRAVTRGDGTKGDVVTENIKTIRNIPLHIKGDKVPEKFEVRGEIFLPRKEFDKINAEREANGEALLANPRNAASGTVKMQDSSIVAKRRLNCYFYQLLGEEIGVEEHDKAIHQLEQWGFNVSPTYAKCLSVQDVLSYINEWQEKRFELPLDTDGVVLKVNNYDQREELGFTAKIPRWAIAYKYQAESAISQLLSITYQVGRTGAITPVANLAPVHLAGTTVKRASLHNANEIERLGLHEGDWVSIEKGGEIIPKITTVISEKRKTDAKPIAYIQHCPECHTELTRKEGEAKHYCPNHAGCPPQILGRIEHFLHKRAMDIDSLGTERIKTLIDQGYIKNYADLYELETQKDRLLGLEMSQDQYQKTEEGYLYISLLKAFFALTEGISLSAIQKFLAEEQEKSLEETLKSFELFIRKSNKKVAQNTGNLLLLKDHIHYAALPTLEEYVPVSAVLKVLLGSRVSLEELLRVSAHCSTVHAVLLELNLDLPSEVEDRIKKLKANTFQEGVISNMMEGIEKSKQQGFPKVLFALGIRNIGENTAQILAKEFKSIDALKTASAEALLAVNGVGETLVQSIQEFFGEQENLTIIERLRGHGLSLDMQEEVRVLDSNQLEGMKILASGKLNHFKRDEIIDFIESNGGTYVKAVSKSLDFIIEGEDMGPSKKEKAEKLGVKMISEEEFMKMVGKS